MSLEYKICSEASAAELEDRVNESISWGWVPLGGVCLSRVDVGPSEDFAVWLCQAMTREVS